MREAVGLIGRKLGMTQIFREDGRPVPVTVLEAGPCTVIQTKTKETDGYRAVQVGFEEIAQKLISKPLQGHFTKAKAQPKRILREFRIPADLQLELGSTLTVELFKPGDRVDVTGTSLGKGFQGGVKRWHWKGGPQTHGSMSHRRPGSIGSSTNPSRVFKGHHLPGHMGHERVTTQSLEVVRVDLTQNLLLLKGAVPGHDKAVVVVVRSRKQRKVQVIAPHAKKKGAAPQAAKKAAPAAAKEKKKG